MMSSLQDLQLLIAKEIVTDETLTNYCQEKFGNEITVYIGIDQDDLPRAGEVNPWVGLAVPLYQTESNIEDLVSSFVLDSAVYCKDESEPFSDADYSNIKIIQGNKTIEELSDLVFAAILRAVSRSATQLVMSYHSQTETSLGALIKPHFAATRTWTIGITN